MNKFKILSCITLGIIFSFMLLISCSDDDSSTGPGNPPDDITGYWLAEEIITGDCEGDAYPVTRFEIIEIAQTENDLSVKLAGSDESFDGSVSGNSVTWTMSLDDDGGTLEINFSGTVSLNGLSISGHADWTWKNESGVAECGGTAQVEAAKMLNPSVDVTGVWNGNWQSESGQMNGAFSVNLVQNSSILTGTINVPFIGLENAILKGAVSGDNVTFGDIDDIIKFTGIINSDSVSAAGNYTYPGYDQGTWTAEKSGIINGFSVSVLSSFQVSVDAARDITWDGSGLWIRGQDRFFQYSPDGNLMNQAVCPGSYPMGLAFDGACLISADNNWGTGTIYRLSTDGNSIFNSPGSGNITGLHFDGEYYWAVDNNYSGLMIYQMNSGGIVIDSIDCPGESAGGITREWDNLWISIRNMGEVKICKLDTEGHIVHSIDTEDFMPGSITFDGLYLWYSPASGSSAIQMDTLGNVLNTVFFDCNSVKDITHDGANLWAICGEIAMDSTYIYKLSETGEIISTIRTAGTGPGGLAFDGEFLRHADVLAEKVYGLNPGIENFYTLPDWEFDYLDHYGSSFWAADNMERRIFNFNYEGSILSSFDFPFMENGGDCGGIALDGNSIWFIEKNFWYFVKLYQLDFEGNLQTQYTPVEEFSEPGGLTYDGQNFWYQGYDQSDQTYHLYELELQE